MGESIPTSVYHDAKGVIHWDVPRVGYEILLDDFPPLVGNGSFRKDIYLDLVQRESVKSQACCSREESDQLQ